MADSTGITPTLRRRGRNFGPAKVGLWGPPIALLALIIIGAYVANALLGTRAFLLPQPHVVLGKLVEPKTAPDIFEALGNTAVVALVGLLIASVIGIVWAIAMSQARWVERTLFPYAVVLQAIPIIAITPLIGFSFGYDFPSRVVVAVMIALFPMVGNTLFGLQSVDKGQRELFQLQKAGRWTVLTKLEFPAALPAIFAGMRISAGLSVIGAIVGDTFFRRGQPGLGNLISVYASRVQTAELYAAVITSALLGVVIFLVFGLIGKLAVGRWYTSS